MYISISMISLQNASSNRFSNIVNTGGDSDSTLEFQVGEAGSPSTAMTIHEDGKVGINETTPVEKLHVIGNIRCVMYVIKMLTVISMGFSNSNKNLLTQIKGGIV